MDIRARSIALLILVAAGCGGRSLIGYAFGGPGGALDGGPDGAADLAPIGPRCESSSDCPRQGDAPGSVVCEVSSGECYSCVSNADCTAPNECYPSSHTCDLASGKSASGTVSFVENALVAASGVTVGIDGITEVSFSGTTTSTGDFMFEIPQSVMGKPQYLAMTGPASVLLTTLRAPPLLLDGSPRVQGLVMHAFLNQDGGTRIRGQLEQALKTHGNISQMDDFAATYSFLYGRVYEPELDGTQHEYHGFAYSIVTAEGTFTPSGDCDPKTYCCPFYIYEFNCFTTMANGCSQAQTNGMMIAFDETQAPSPYLAVICPAAIDSDITFHMTSPVGQLLDGGDLSPTIPWPDAAAPRPGPSSTVGVFLEWSNYYY